MQYREIIYTELMEAVKILRQQIENLREDLKGYRLAARLLSMQRDLAVSLGQVRTLDEGVERIMAVLCGVEGIDCLGFHDTDPVRGDIVLKAHRGISRAVVKTVRHFSAADPRAVCLFTGRPAHFHPDEFPPGLETVAADGVRALAVFPVYHGPEPRQYLVVASRKSDSFPPQVIHALETTAAMLGRILGEIRQRQAREESEARYRLLVESAPYGMNILDLDGSIVLINARAASLHGFRNAEELLAHSRDAFAYVHPQECQRLRGIMHRIIATDDSISTRSIFLHRDGGVFPVEVGASLLKGTEGRPEGIIVISRKIEERKEGAQ